MKASELIRLLQEEIANFEDRDVIIVSCSHGSQEGERIDIGRLGWWGDIGKKERAIYLTCVECDVEDQIENAQGEHDCE